MPYDVEDANYIFTVINNRGKPLSDCDKMKSQICYCAHNLRNADKQTKILDRVKNTWSFMYRTLASLRCNDTSHSEQYIFNAATDIMARHEAKSKDMLVLEKFQKMDHNVMVYAIECAVYAYADLIVPEERFKKLTLERLNLPRHPLKPYPEMLKELYIWVIRCKRLLNKSMTHLLPLITVIYMTGFRGTF